MATSFLLQSLYTLYNDRYNQLYFAGCKKRAAIAARFFITVITATWPPSLRA